MTKQELLTEIQTRRRADIEARKLAVARGKRNQRYRTLLKLHHQGRSIENIAKLTGMSTIHVVNELVDAAVWWEDASKHINANLEAAINPPENN